MLLVLTTDLKIIFIIIIIINFKSAILGVHKRDKELVTYIAIVKIK